MVLKEILKRLIAAVVLWALLIASSFLYSYLHPSMLAYAGLALLVLWYFYIPVLFVVVTIAWPLAQKFAGRKREQVAHKVS